MRIGFSTGSLALSDLHRGIKLAFQSGTDAIELSALREEELEPLLNSLPQLDLSRFAHVSVHAPSRLVKLSESRLVDLLQQVVRRHWSVIVHPDIVKNFSVWRQLGEYLCLENMDKRKPTGRTVAELRHYFDGLSQATFCCDMGHVRQIDPTMLEARRLLRTFGSRLRQVHLSYVNSACKHEALNYESIIAFRRVVGLIKDDVTVILEAPVSGAGIAREIEAARTIMNREN